MPRSRHVPRPELAAYLAAGWTERHELPASQRLEAGDAVVVAWDGAGEPVEPEGVALVDELALEAGRG